MCLAIYAGIQCPPSTFTPTATAVEAANDPLPPNVPSGARVGKQRLPYVPSGAREDGFTPTLSSADTGSSFGDLASSVASPAEAVSTLQSVEMPIRSGSSINRLPDADGSSQTEYID